MEAAERLALVAARTMIGCASVRLADRSSDPAVYPDSVMTGVIDFDRDRCELEGVPGHLVMTDACSYLELPDGRWRAVEGEVGERDIFDPRRVLLQLRDHPAGARWLDRSTCMVEFDHAALSSATIAGVAPTWRVTAEVVIGAGERVKRFTERYVDREDPAVWIIREFCLSRLGRAVSVRALPPPERTIAIGEYLAELRGASDQA